MLKITQAQVSAFEDAAAARFAREVAQRLAQEGSAGPDADGRYAEADLLRMCTDGIGRGRQCGLREKAHLMVFVRIAAVLGLEFYDLVTVRLVMEDPFLALAEKINFLVATMQCLLAQQEEEDGDEEPEEG
jgi:hypothetical protein